MSQSNKKIGNIDVSVEKIENIKKDLLPDKIEIIPQFSEWSIINFNIDTVVERPESYKIEMLIGPDSHIIDSVEFHHLKIRPFTPEEIKALESNPYSVKGVQIILGCKHCSFELKIYSALKRSKEWESQGSLWQYDIDESYVCDCGKTKYDTTYIKENLHAGLTFDVHSLSGVVSYERRYAHKQIIHVLSTYNNLLDEEKDEAPLQKFIENHPLLLAKFSATKIFYKPTILGKFQTDFVILDTSKKLIFIEIEKPNLPLFKKNSGHPTAQLNHAYEQVRDWLNEYSKYSDAILESLHLETETITAVKGAVIAGRSEGVKPEHLQRHLSKPLNNDIDFCTFDDLGNSLAQISRTLI